MRELLCTKWKRNVYNCGRLYTIPPTHLWQTNSDEGIPQTTWEHNEKASAMRLMLLPRNGCSSSVIQSEKNTRKLGGKILVMDTNHNFSIWKECQGGLKQQVYMTLRDFPATKEKLEAIRRNRKRKWCVSFSRWSKAGPKSNSKSYGKTGTSEASKEINKRKGTCIPRRTNCNSKNHGKQAH